MGRSHFCSRHFCSRPVCPASVLPDVGALYGRLGPGVGALYGRLGPNLYGLEPLCANMKASARLTASLAVLGLCFLIHRRTSLFAICRNCSKISNSPISSLE